MHELSVCASSTPPAGEETAQSSLIHYSPFSAMPKREVALSDDKFMFYTRFRVKYQMIIVREHCEGVSLILTQFAPANANGKGGGPQPEP